MCFTTPIFQSIAVMTPNTASLPIEKRFKTFLSHRMQNGSFNSAGFGVKKYELVTGLVLDFGGDIWHRELTFIIQDG